MMLLNLILSVIFAEAAVHQITVQRGITDVFSSDEAAHGNCHAFNARQLDNTKCACEPNENLFSFYRHGSKAGCISLRNLSYDKSIGAIFYVPVTRTSLQIRHRKRLPFLRCIMKPIKRIQVWNIKGSESNDFLGNWLDLYPLLSNQFEIYGQLLRIKLDKQTWQGHLIKLDLDCMLQSVLLKLEGSITYPFDINEIVPFKREKDTNDRETRDKIDMDAIIIVSACFLVCVILICRIFMSPAVFYENLTCKKMNVVKCCFTGYVSSCRETPGATNHEFVAVVHIKNGDSGEAVKQSLEDSGKF